MDMYYSILYSASSIMLYNPLTAIGLYATHENSPIPMK